MALALRKYKDVGRGVYSTTPLNKGDIVEIAPVLVFSAKDWRSIRGTVIEAYVFAWGKTGRACAMPLGYGGLFNHSDKPNLNFWLNQRKEVITFRARRSVPAGEQLTIDYGWSKKDKRRWFKHERKE